MSGAAASSGKLDICVSENSSLVHLEIEGTGRQLATTNAGTKEERIANALRLMDCWNSHDGLIKRAESAEAELEQTRQLSGELLEALMTCRNALKVLQVGSNTNIVAVVKVADAMIEKAGAA